MEKEKIQQFLKEKGIEDIITHYDSNDEPLTPSYIVEEWEKFKAKELEQFKDRELWDKKITPKEGYNTITQDALDWWHQLPIQDLKDMSDSWVGYLWKYFPDKPHPYHLTVDNIKFIYINEFFLPKENKYNS